MKKIVFRADDAGSSEGANIAILRTVREGVVRNVGVMAPGPALSSAAELLRDLEGVNLGLHVTLNAEWDRVKWGPVLPAAEVPSLVEVDGSFTSEPATLKERGFSVDEAMAEVAAQLAKLRESGLRIDYLDEHMGVGWIGLVDRLEEFCSKKGLVFARRVPFLEGSQTQDVSALLETISAASDAPHVVVAHPGSDVDPTMRQFTLGGMQPGEVLRERAQDRRVLTDPRLVDAVRQGRILSMTYREAAQ
ncbi:carbohydrate deacetylase [Fimbriimonas ginsengisoli]|uniref:YdjC family protein n=1 Tax=Fimbriimonas ginsengisoli Gsoil 348 TaxID=661478 RepID=A0A068NUG8_FIMGI|nr:ChbG/HpnK family deacetylase [Fimbriimonas ginsengisoli]AIE87173.1 YdjC family protein [Fimbriimonas ginsengisoli Gsoil 348]